MAQKRRSTPDQPTNLPAPRSRTLPLPPGSDAFLKDLKDRIRSAQIKAAPTVNRELVLLYWSIGRDILAQQQHGWGAKVIDRLAADLHHAFPEAQGFSPRNLKYMRAFAQAWPEEAIVQQAAAQIPWFHNCARKTGLGESLTSFSLILMVRTDNASLTLEGRSTATLLPL